MVWDVARIRGLYPTLGAGAAHLDGSYDALKPETVIRAIISTLRSAPAQPGSRSPGSQYSEGAATSARRAVADLVNGEPDAVVLGGTVSTVLQYFGAILARTWQLGDEIVLSRLDQDAHVRAWMPAAKAGGVIVRWAEVDVETAALPEWQYDRLTSRRTRLVTIPLANPATGVVPAVRQIADLAHEVGALVVVDAGAALPHFPIDMVELGADLLCISMAGFGGPTVGAVAARRGLLDELADHAPSATVSAYELGSLPVELLGGVTAAIEHLATLDESAVGSRRERLVASLTGAGDYERTLFADLDRRLRELPGVLVLGEGETRVPVTSLTVEGCRPAEVGDFLQSRGVSVWTGANGMSQLMRALGTDELGGTVQIGLMPHSTAHEVDKLVEAVAALVRERRPADSRRRVVSADAGD
jgi:cysteine desulfurase family protein (TIGR01976 family)